MLRSTLDGKGVEAGGNDRPAPALTGEVTVCKKTELGVSPGLTINFMRYTNLGAASQLVEGVRMQTNALTASQFSITVAEHGYAIAVTELLLNASFDDVMASGSRLLGRNMAQYLDNLAQSTLLTASSLLFGYYRNPAGAITNFSPYDFGTVGTSANGLTGQYYLTPSAIRDGVETLATKNVPRIGESYVGFCHPHQSRHLRESPEWIEVTKYASPGNFMLGEIGRLFDTIWIETTQVAPTFNSTAGANVYNSILIGDNAFGHAISLPVELRDGGVLDFGREHALAWYAILGMGLITDQSVVVLATN